MNFLNEFFILKKGIEKIREKIEKNHFSKKFPKEKAVFFENFKIV